MLRQQILYLWLAEGSLDSSVVGWAFHDGAQGRGPGFPAGDPPYATGVAALSDGWFLLQSAALVSPPPGAEHEVGYLPNEFLFERRVELPES